MRRVAWAASYRAGLASGFALRAAAGAGPGRGGQATWDTLLWRPAPA